MKSIFHFARLFTGALFIFSGIVKLNDPSGFAIKLNEYFDVFAEDVAVEQDSVIASIYAGDKIVGQRNFELYTSDETKTVEIEYSGDTALEELNIRWGGSRYDIELSDSFDFTQPYHLVLHSWQGPDKVCDFESDSISSNIVLRQEKYLIDVSDWVKTETALAGFFKSCKDYSLYFSGFFCALEVILGFAMLIGWQFNLTITVTALLIGFFTFLTWYSAYFNKVTDCGCFGDFIKLKPWDSFKKDIVLSILVLILIFGRKHNRTFFLKSKANIVIGVFSILTFGFGWYCYRFLPIWDFLPYKEGNDIKYIMTHVPEGERESDSIRIRFVMKKDQDSLFVTTSQYADYARQGYQFVRQDREIIIPGYESPIHDFAIYDPNTGEDLKNQMLDYKGYQYIFVMPFMSELNKNSLPAASACFQWAKKKGIPFYGLTSASADVTAAFKKQQNIDFDIYSADQKMLMTMARYNPTLYLFNGSTVEKKWSGASMPSVEVVENLTQ